MDIRMYVSANQKLDKQYEEHPFFVGMLLTPEVFEKLPDDFPMYNIRTGAFLVKGHVFDLNLNPMECAIRGTFKREFENDGN